MSSRGRHLQPGALSRWSIHLALYTLALTMLLPFAWMISTSLKTRGEAINPSPTLLPAGAPWDWQWENYAQAWETASLGRYYLNSLLVALIVTLLAGTHDALAGYALAKMRFAGRRAALSLMLLVMMLPAQVSFIFAYVICGWIGYVDNYQALIVPFLASAFGIFYMRQAISTVPDDLLDAGRLDGLRDFEIFLHLIVPSIRPALAALAIFTFIGSWNSFFWPLIVIDSNDLATLPLAVAAFSSQYYTDSWPVQMAAATIITLPLIVVFLIFQRAFVEGVTLTGIKG